MSSIQGRREELMLGLVVQLTGLGLTYTSVVLTRTLLMHSPSIRPCSTKHVPIGEGQLLMLKMAAESRQARQDTSNTTNPEFERCRLGTFPSFGESTAYLVVLGDKHKSTAKEWVEYFFGKLPRIQYLRQY
jgi:hypothetical protein